MSSRFLVALKSTRNSALKVVESLVALKAAVKMNVNFNCWLDFVALEVIVARNDNSHC